MKNISPKKIKSKGEVFFFGSACGAATNPADLTAEGMVVGIDTGVGGDETGDGVCVGVPITRS